MFLIFECNLLHRNAVGGGQICNMMSGIDQNTFFVYHCTLDYHVYRKT